MFFENFELSPAIKNNFVSHEEMDQLRGIQRLIKTDMDFALVAGF